MLELYAGGDYCSGGSPTV